MSLAEVPGRCTAFVDVAFHPNCYRIHLRMMYPIITYMLAEINIDNFFKL